MFYKSYPAVYICGTIQNAQRANVINGAKKRNEEISKLVHVDKIGADFCFNSSKVASYRRQETVLQLVIPLNRNEV